MDVRGKIDRGVEKQPKQELGGEEHEEREILEPINFVY